MNRHAHSVQIVQLFLRTEAKIKYWNHSSVYIRSQRRVVCGLKWHLHLRQQHQRENPLHMCLAFVQYMCLLSLALRSLPPPTATVQKDKQQVSLHQVREMTSHAVCRAGQQKSLFVWLLSTYVYLHVQRHVQFIELLSANICRALTVIKTEVAAHVSSASAEKCSFPGREGTSVLSGFQTLHLHLHLHLSGTCYSHSASLNHTEKGCVSSLLQAHVCTCSHMQAYVWA